ncbi:set5 [Symbiodinium microadriaticum]|nr:set5 [Symbiodinium microadriaticum]
MKATDLLEMALQAPEEEQVVQRVGRKSILRIWLSSLCFLELAICGALLWTLETAAGGWSEGTCSISMFTNITCREQTTTRCAVDLEVRGSLDGRLRFYTMQNWYLPVSYKTEMGGNSYAAYLGDRLKCCNEREGEAAGQVGGCCSLMEPTTEIFCDNLQLLGATAFDGTECPGNGWNCLYLVDDIDPARAKAVRTYTPPNITNFIVPIGIVAAILVVSVLSSAIMICCRKVSDRLPERFHRRSVDYEDAEDALEDMERDGSSKARSAAGSQGSPGQSPRSASSSKRRSKLSKKDLSMPMEVVEEIGDSSPTATVTSGSFRDFSKMSGPSGPSRQQSFMEAPVALSTAVASVPEAVLSLPGVVQELENAAALKKGEAQQRKAVEEECRKYLKWEAHEKPIHTLEEKDIHPDFRNGNLSRYAVMAQQAQSQNAILSPLIEPLPPSTHQPPKLPGSRPGSSRPGSRPGTAGRPQSVQAEISIFHSKWAAWGLTPVLRLKNFPSMHMVPVRYSPSEREVHLGVDTKMKAARKEARTRYADVVFPKSRPRDDWFHVKQKQKTLARKTIKKNAAWIEAALNAIRSAPTLPVFATCWDGLLDRLTGEGEPDVRGSSKLWVVTEALRTMENLYEKWCSYYDVTALRTLPPQVDPSHMHGDVLARAGRSTGLKYVAAHAANPSLVLYNLCELRGTGHILAMLRSLEGTSPIVRDAAAAQRSLDLLQAKPAEVKSLLEHAGILATTAAGPSFSLAAYNHHFQDIVHVRRKTGPGVPDLCSCRAFTLHAGCEHVVFSASLELPGCEPQSSVSPAVEFCLARISARPCKPGPKPKRKREGDQEQVQTFDQRNILVDFFVDVVADVDEVPSALALS